MNMLRLFGLFFRVNVLSELSYRANFFIQVFQSLLELVTSLAGLAVIFSYTSTLGGWRPDEILALLGVYFLMGGLIGLVIQPAMSEFIDSVRDGALDFVLTKPEDAQLLVSFKRVEIWQLIDIGLGVMVLFLALFRLGEPVSIFHVVEFIVMLAAGAVIIYSFWLILATLSFWFVRVENILEIFRSMYEAGRWPISIYPGWLRFALTFLVPVAFAVTVPTEALTARLSPASLVVTIVLTVAIFFLSRFFWRRGLRRYSGASA